MNPSEQTFSVPLPAPATKFDRERAAFLRLLPSLLKTHDGRYVAIHEERVVDDGPDRLEVAMRVLRRVGNVDIYVGLVSETPEPLARSGVIRSFETPGAAT